MSLRKEFPKPPFPKQSQTLPGSSKAMDPERATDSRENARNHDSLR